MNRLPMTLQEATEINKWQYEAPYDFYNGEDSKEDLEEYLNGTFYALMEQNTLIGYYCTGNSAIVSKGNSVGAYTTKAIDFGLGMVPTLTGQGRGKEFLTHILKWIEEDYPNIPVRLTVATFNIRAIRLYESLGFKKELVFQAPSAQFQTMILQKNSHPSVS